MFRDTSSAYDRIAESIGDIGERIGELEHQISERISPTPSITERVRRSVGFPSRSHSFLPDTFRNLSMPTVSDARSSYRSLIEAMPDLRGQLSELRSHLPSWGASELASRLPDPRLPRAPSFRRGMQAQQGLAFLRGRPALTTVLVAGGVIAVVGAAFYVSKKVAEHTEEPDYDTVRTDGDIEIRDYDAMIVAETIKSGYHEKARRIGFETLADYIFAGNRAGKKIAMTAPVLQQLSENEGKTKGWAIRFVMPKKFTKDTLPAPGSDDVAIRELPSKRVVAIRFNGNFTASLASKKLMILYNYIAEENMKQKGDPEYAFYNPPWTPGFMKRNEILIEVER
ncbi:hypothetical protein Sa4125_16440 [Aureimonas sp. SA4125]|uniref:SOUL family heme-binding protein n=1 Tax=Aureimonas sp. SA4125 TaxID=2826993 RepID=UPI001CC721ED|nr:heme-binding protein [Aureimonas sp. SA4125]BDA84102.1 hypothetical protein Sa4125_16440 [Aureimonas sp. SA4125]